MIKKPDFSLCIFDLDGVIVDTAKYHYLAWKKLANSFDFELTKKHNEQLKGVGRIQSLEYILALANVSFSDGEKLKLTNKKNGWYLESIKELGKGDALPGVVDLILELRTNNIKTAIGSASKNAKLILESLEIIHLFDAIVDGNMTQKGKPNPEVFFQGAELTDTSPSETIVFEDAAKGVEAALRANMLAIGIGDEKTLGHAHSVISGFTNFKFEDLVKIAER